MSFNKPSEGFERLVTHGREMTEAYGVEVQLEQLLKRLHRLPRLLGDSRGRWAKPPGELVLQRIPDDDGPFLREVESDAARGMSGKMDHADLGPKRKDVAILEAIVNGNGPPH